MYEMKRNRFLVLLILAFFLTFSAHPAAAQFPSRQLADETTNFQGPVDAAEVEAFLDEFFNQQIEDYHFAGITAVVVRDGQILFQKGYGYTDIENQIPVDPAKSLFRIGSVTKLFTWTAIMQLYEQDKLDLDADINTYLNFQIPDTFPSPITLKHLMSHTGGFEDRSYELAVLTPDRIQPLGQYLETHMPARVYPPGQVSAYSNYGTDLAGYIIERVSGISYADYIEANILEPLGMKHTTSLQPLPAHLTEGMSNGYIYARNSYLQKDFQIGSTQSCGAMSSSAEDIARFMIAHLQSGSLCPRGVSEANLCGSILNPATEKLMQTSLWGPTPSVPSFTYGFMEWNFNGQRILYHPGDTQVFQSMMMLLPDQDLGFFYSYNTSNPAIVPWDTTLIAFMQHYYPVERIVSLPDPDFASRAEAYTGNYYMGRSSHTTIEKVFNLSPSRWIQLTSSEDGALLLGLPISSIKVRLEEIEQGLFQEATTGLQFVLKVDDQSNSVYMYDTHQPSAAWIKMPWHANPMLHYGLLLASGLIFLSALLAGLIRGIANLFKRGEHLSQSKLILFARWNAALVALFNCSALFAFLVIFLDGSRFLEMVGYGQMSGVDMILTFWLAAAVLTIPLIFFTIIVWMKGLWGVISRVHYTLVTLAALAFIWFLNYWNLIGFRY